MANSAPLSSWRECFVVKRIRMLVPVGFKTEIKELSKLAAPVVIAQLMVFAVSFVSTIFCGHLGRKELAGVSLAISVINVTGVSIGAGLASACDTLMSQTFGSNNLLRVGVILQRAILILLLACFPCWAILVNTEGILLAVRQEPEVARLSQMYVTIFMPALPATFMYSLQARYLQNQGIIWPQVITGIVVNLLNVLINYIFLYLFKMGVAGSAVANTVSQFSLASVLYAYIMWKGLHKATWGGWSKECLQDWGSYINVAIPSMIMMCVEWWTYEIGGFLAGLISEVELGAQAVVYEIASVAYMFPLGLSIAGNVRVGNALGAGDTEQAKLSAKLTMFCAVSVSICLSVVIGSLHNHISYVFTDDEQIRERVADVIALYAPFILLDAIAAASGGIIRGTGKQKIGAICNILGYYGVGFPIGVSLMFAAKMGIKGLWSGLFICVFLQSSFLIFYLIRMNWVKARDEAQIRAGVREKIIDTSPQLDDPRQTDTTDMVLPEAEPAVKTVEDGFSYRALVLNRGLILAVMLLILAVGIILNLLITNLIT
ncbi:multidrug and toxin extrusion protein 1 [Pseudoliparis swirei]|uniref:multidrug and toxin extrusion protein 1 n=1 Tax=Pseudoliparis swirei TaxID=2059687 RepID=UPI0024BDC803|nr:multidrug and toxin extrusion protein 1 [Pseudoliparis swirei]XP_056297126.1 multidrug and toxin extrusion protein 1 [Pseudoliparis swirei]